MKEEPTRSDYKVFYPVTTRWMDNDLYGHINNVVYYSYFDTVVNLYLIGKGGLNIHSSPIVGYVVNSGCNYLSPIGYPDRLEAGLRVDRIGNTSVHYGIAIFKEGSSLASAYGHVVHVFVNRDLNKPVPLPAEIHYALAEILA
jgi:acyl-CoA thioester hydrolase